MRFSQLIAAALLLLFVGSAAQAAQPQMAPAVAPMNQNATAGYARTILAKVNELRASKGLAPVTRYRELDAVAADWSRQMALQASLSHRPNFTTHYPSGWTNAAENVAMHGGSGDIGTMMFELWLNSPGHYANMVNPELNAIGIGLAYDSTNKAWYATQNFAHYPEASGLTKVGSESPPASPSPTPSPKPTPKPTPSSVTPSPSPSPSVTASPSPEPTPAPTPSTSEPSPAPSETATQVTLPRQLVEDSTPSPAAKPTSPAPAQVSTSRTPTQAPVAPVTLAELDDPAPSWGWIALGVAAAGAATAGLVLLARRLL
ncbi:MAG: CAP domain-containing protein [Propionibacteriaceae bacterium]|nr:CAP domain-containing protein [Propionibacteriaceae bacterium]